MNFGLKEPNKILSHSQFGLLGIVQLIIPKESHKAGETEYE